VYGYVRVNGAACRSQKVATRAKPALVATYHLRDCDLKTLPRRAGDKSNRELSQQSAVLDRLERKLAFSRELEATTLLATLAARQPYAGGRLKTNISPINKNTQDDLLVNVNTPEIHNYSIWS
jgi:hypothetical protein